MLNNLFHKPQSNKFRVLSVFWPASIRGWKIEAGICQFLIYCRERDFTLFRGGGCGGESVEWQGPSWISDCPRCAPPPTTRARSLNT